MPRPRRPRATRTAAGEDTRARVLAAARELAVEEGFDGFTVEKVAARAGVSRMTVYYQFGGKQDLLNALFDHVAARGRIDRLGEAFRQPDPLDALAVFIGVFCGFWASDRVGIRRLRGWGYLRSEFESTGHERDAWRRQGLEMIVGRIRERYGVPAGDAVQDVIDVLLALTSFESYDVLVRGGREEAEVAALMTEAARAVLGVGGEAGG
ncbi:MAG TPA: TetR/AcrR family transcriptional regulator [Longimicrobiales bacterium]